MGDRRCAGCGASNASTARYCTQCGRHLVATGTPVTLGRYTPLRIQVDPTEPTPPRYARWLLLVAGAALAVAGVLFLVVYGIVGDALQLGGAGCGSRGSSTDCGSAVFGYVLLLPGVVLVVLGLAFSGLAFWRVLHGPMPRS